MCTGAFFEMDLSSQSPISWIVGASFLKNVYSVFRYNPLAIGFAQLSGTAQTVSNGTTVGGTATNSTGTGGTPGSGSGNGTGTGSGSGSSGGAGHGAVACVGAVALGSIGAIFAAFL